MDDLPLVPLSEQECWDLLAGESLGRLATSVSDEPDIFPLNFVVDHQTLVFRTAEGSKLMELIIQNNVAFEVDAHTNQTGWSVVVKGTAQIVDADDLDQVRSLPLRPWVPTLKQNFVRIVPGTVTGRRAVFGPPPDDEAALANSSSE